MRIYVRYVSPRISHSDDLFNIAHEQISRPHASCLDFYLGPLPSITLRSGLYRYSSPAVSADGQSTYVEVHHKGGSRDRLAW